MQKKIGMEKFTEYIKEFDYGNKDISGENEKNNGLTHSWLGASLKISPLEQIDFISKILDKKLNLSDNAYEMTKKITYIEQIKGWKLHGKTGSCFQRDENGLKNLNRFAGWFVGWLEKDNRKIAFAKFMKDEQDVKKDDYIGIRARNAVIKELESLNLS